MNFANFSCDRELFRLGKCPARNKINIFEKDWGKTIKFYYLLLKI